jgi:hypothetical protein
VTLYAYDGANPGFDLAAAKANGGIVATVYIVGTPGGMPHADRARVAAIRAAGMGVLPNWERAADFFGTCTVADARAAGVEALAACKALGFPADGTIQVPFSFDFDVPSTRFREMGAKVDAVTAGLTSAYVPMVYAQTDLIDYLVSHGYLAGKQWLMASTWGRPYNPASPNVCLVQSHDAAGNWINSHVTGTDINTVTDPHALGAWWPDGSPYSTGGLHMDADVRARFDAIDQRLTALFQVDTTGDGKSDITGTVQAAVRAEVAGVIQLLADMAPRVAATQVAVSSVAKTLGTTAAGVSAVTKAVASIVPGVVDAQALADAVSAKVKALTWKAAE